MKLHIVPANRGVQWAKLGMRTFLKQPLALAGLFFMFMAVLSVATLLPFIGAALALVKAGKDVDYAGAYADIDWDGVGDISLRGSSLAAHLW